MIAQALSQAEGLQGHPTFFSGTQTVVRGLGGPPVRWPTSSAFQKKSEKWVSPRLLRGSAVKLFIGDNNPESRLMALFTAYFDASGDWRSQPFVIVAGYIANLWQWKTLETAWPNIHKEYGVQTPFHMADFIAACTTDTYQRQKNARADYVEIAKDKVRADAF